MRDDDWFTLAELTNRLGALVWVEETLADVLQSWSRIEPHAAVAVCFSTAGRHHRWHSEIVRECLPTSPQLREHDVVVAPTSGWASAVDTLRELDAPDATSTRLKALVRFVDPWIDREIGALIELARPISDADTTRWLRFATIDHQDDASAAESLLANRASDAVRFDEHLMLAELRLSD